MPNMKPDYYSLQSRGVVFGLLRQGPQPLALERYVPNLGAWVSAPSEWAYLLGDELGLGSISEAQAMRLIADGALAPLDEAAVGGLSVPYQPGG